MEMDSKVRAAQDERLLRIGAVCAQWSYLEYVILRTMRKLLDLEEETAKILFGGLDIRPRIAMAIELARHLKAPTVVIETLVTTRAAVDGGLLKRRNRAIHGVQFLYSDGDLFVEVHRGKDRARRELSVTELQSLACEILQVSTNLTQVIGPALWNQPTPPFALLDKPAKRSPKKKAPKPDQTPTPGGRQPRSSVASPKGKKQKK